MAFRPGKRKTVGLVLSRNLTGFSRAIRPALLILLAFASSASIPHASAEPACLPGIVRITVITDSSVTVLPHPFIDPSTLVITTESGDTLSAGSDYVFASTPARIEWLFSQETVSSVSVILSYRHLPVNVERRITLRSVEEARAADSLIQGERVRVIQRRNPLGSSLFEGSDLRRSGFISRGVQIGSDRDVSLESGLRLSLSGELSRDIYVEALLDDRNLPIQPQGTSRRLEEIDQVYVDIDAGRFKGRFGDYRLVSQTGRYGTFERTLEGGLVNASSTRADVSLSGAVTRAQYHTNRFNGIDGVQGPYILRGRNGENPVLVLGGSERVWVDGIQRQRGEVEDYLIDYNRGEITFTPNLPITSESRIEIDFEYSPELYPRNLYSSSGSYRTSNGRFQISVVAIQEVDDYDRPIAFEMTDEIRSSLSDAGDSDNQIYVSSADSLGQGEGDYVRRDTTLAGETWSYFAFVEPDDEGRPRGQWSVLFSEVGAGNGDYRREYDPLLGGYRFEWTGPGTGDWAPVRALAPPVSRGNAAVSLGWQVAGGLRYKSDLGISHRDPNRLSSRQENDQTGLAQQHEMHFALGGTRESGNSFLQSTLKYRDEEATFQPFARSREVEYERRWGTDSLTTGVREQESSADLLVTPLQGVDLRASYGRLERSDQFSSERWEAGGQITKRGNVLRSRVESIRSRDESGTETDWIRGQAYGATRWHIWQPAIEAEVEQRDEIRNSSIYTGYTYQRFRSALSLMEWYGHEATLAHEFRARERQQAADSYTPLYDENAISLNWLFRAAQVPFRGEVTAVHREKTYAVADSSSSTSDLASLSGWYTPLKGALSSELQYRLNRTLTRENALIAYQVPAGEGEYIRVDGEYVYDPEIGDIILRPEPTGDAVPTTDLAASLHLDWSPHRLPGQQAAARNLGWQAVSIETQIEIEEVSTWHQPEEIVFLNVSRFQSDSTISGRMLLRQDFYLFRSRRDVNLRLRYQGDQRLQNLFGLGSESVGSDLWELRLRTTVGDPLDLEFSLTDERRGKNLARRSGTERFRLDRAGFLLSFRYTGAWRFRIETRTLYDQDLSEEFVVRGLGIKPGLTWAARTRGRIAFDFEALWIESDRDRFSFELADSRPKGRNGRGNLRLDYRIAEAFTLRGIYTVRMDQDRAPIHVARLEITAQF